MSRLSAIPIRVLPGEMTPAGLASISGGLGGGVQAILSELMTLLDRLARTEKGGLIDLRSLPMSGVDRATLKQTLGDGEICATLDAQGLSTFQETSVPGIWWIEHRDGSGELIAELLEVAAVPGLLVCAPDEIAAGPGLLRTRMSALHRQSGGEGS